MGGGVWFRAVRYWMTEVLYASTTAHHLDSDGFGIVLARCKRPLSSRLAFLKLFRVRVAMW